MFTAILYMPAQKSSNLKSLANLIALNEKHSNVEFSASSFCEARKKFPPYLFVNLSQWVYSYVEHKLKKGKWFARSMFAIDSTSLTLPRELADVGFGHEETGEFYPLATLTVLYDVRLGMIYDSIISQHRSERLNATHLFKGVPEGSIVIGDRGFFSFELLHEPALPGLLGRGRSHLVRHRNWGFGTERSAEASACFTKLNMRKIRL